MCEIFSVAHFFLNFNCTQIMGYWCQKCKKKTGVTKLISEIKCVGNYPDFEKLTHIIQYGLKGVIHVVKNVEGELMEANDLNHVL